MPTEGCYRVQVAYAGITLANGTFECVVLSGRLSTFFTTSVLQFVSVFTSGAIAFWLKLSIMPRQSICQVNLEQYSSLWVHFNPRLLSFTHKHLVKENAKKQWTIAASVWLQLVTQQWCKKTSVITTPATMPASSFSKGSATWSRTKYRCTFHRNSWPSRSLFWSSYQNVSLLSGYAPPPRWIKFNRIDGVCILAYKSGQTFACVNHR